MSEARSGRTTRMLLAAAIAISEGKTVILVGHTADYASQLLRRLRDILKWLDIPEDARQLRCYSMQDETPREAMEIFVDHYCEESDR